MTRGLRKRPLIEPIPDPPVVYEQSASDVTVSERAPSGKWLPGHKAAIPYSKHAKSLTDALRQAFPPERIIAEYEYHVFVKHSETALINLVDRVAGRPMQAIELSRSEDDPAVIAAKQMADAWDRISLGLPPLTLIEAPVSQGGSGNKAVNDASNLETLT